MAHKDTMKTPRLYQNTELNIGDTLSLDDGASRHLIKVLRATKDAPLTLFNGDGLDYAARIVSAQMPCTVELLASEQNTTESPLHLTLVQGIAKGEKMDFLMQKAVELGVNRIIPMDSSRCVVRLKGEKAKRRLEHWQKIIIHACEQSGRAVIPELLPIHSLSQVLDLELGSPFVLHHRADTPLSAYDKPTAASVIIGPEGGLSGAEIEQAVAAHCQPLLLGKRILRTETASLVALANMQLLWGS